MPKNKGKGGKNRRRGKNENDFMKRELDKKEIGQEYGQVVKMLGNGRVEAFCFDGKKRICHIRGKLRKKVWINHHDIILVGLRDFQDDKADVILKYTPDEARRLKADGELPENAKINENDEQEEGEIVFQDLGGAGEDDAADDDSDMPSDSESDSEEEESGDDKDSDDSSDEESDEASFLNEEDLARGRGLGGTREKGRRQKDGKDKYGKRR